MALLGRLAQAELPFEVPQPLGAVRTVGADEIVREGLCDSAPFGGIFRGAVDASTSRAGVADASPSTPTGGELVKMLYRLLSLLFSVLGGILAGAVFKKVWAVVSDEKEAPQATSPEYSTKEVLVAAVIQGAIFAGVKAAVDRAGAKGFKIITGKDLGT